MTGEIKSCSSGDDGEPRSGNAGRDGIARGMARVRVAPRNDHDRTYRATQFAVRPEGRVRGPDPETDLPANLFSQNALMPVTAGIVEAWRLHTLVTGEPFEVGHGSRPGLRRQCTLATAER